jgi:hypothetical protein
MKKQRVENRVVDPDPDFNWLCGSESGSRIQIQGQENAEK